MIEKKEKIRLGKQTEEGYEYASSLRFDKDLLAQVEEFQKEESVRERLRGEVKTLRDFIGGFTKREKNNNIFYYRAVGRKLRFLEKSAFKGVELWSAFRLIYEWLPDILPHISKPRVARNHIATMYYLDKVDERDLGKADWRQWYSIAMFPELFTSRKHYKKILAAINQSKIKGSLREAIPIILKKS